MSEKSDSKLQEISTAVKAVIAVAPLLQGNLVATAIGLTGVGLTSMLENIRSRTKKLDDMVSEVLADEKLKARLDETVKMSSWLCTFGRVTPRRRVRRKASCGTSETSWCTP